MPSIYSEKH